MKKRLSGIAAAMVLALAVAPVALSQAGGAGGGAATGPAPLAKMEALAAANRASLVVVKYQLQYDKGDAPQGSGFAERCPYCGQYHSVEDFENIVQEERPLERSGVLVDGTHVVTDDLQLHPRFIKSIKVDWMYPDAGASPYAPVAAAISAYPKEQNAVILEMAGPFPGVKPASFDAQRAGPYTSVHLAQAEGRWNLGLQALPQDLILTGGKSYFASARGLVVDKDGGPVGMTTGLEIPADGTWKGNPLQWPAFSSTGMKDLLGKVQARVDKGIVPVTLNFRSPKSNGPRERFSSRDEESTVQHVLGVFTDSKTVLVLANLKSTATARLERIRVMADPPMDAKFKATLTDYGALVAQTDTAVSGAPGLSTADLGALRGAALPAADILLQGENRVTYYQPRRIASLRPGFHGDLYPQLPGMDENMFLFDAQGDLLVLPLAQREKASTASRYGGGGRGMPTSVQPVRQALADLGAHSDLNNVPLSEEEEGRLAWLGVELQALTRDLARANNVSDQTKDGETGALVTFVYPDSPAAQAGVEPGWVLLRLDVDGQPKPIDVQLESDRYSDAPFPWDRLDQASETVFDQIPTPWPSAENALLRSLTDIGFGKKFVAEFSHDKTLDKKNFSVVQGPPTYNSAPKYSSAGLGITVRNLTYEVRRYMQKKDDEPGVIVGKIELGSKASVAGLKPYEVITHVNDQPVLNVKEFEAASKDQTDLRLSVKRMAAGRIVKITLPQADSAATQPK